MEIQEIKVPIRELVEGYADNDENGVYAYGGKLNVRPPYQREFIYDDNKRDAVIDTVFQKFPLNIMYWAVCSDGSYEIIDGQQRTISICQYFNGDFAHDFQYFDNVKSSTPEKADDFLKYELTVYLCTGTEDEKLKWFERINIAGEELTNQELLNAVYHGPWVSDAKRFFSKTGCAAYQIASDYVNGSPIRQDYLETAISWISKGNIKLYMAKHQNDANANALWTYFQSVINWVKVTFVKTRKYMKGVDWGTLYEQFHDALLDINAIEKEISLLMMDDDVTNKKGIYFYVLTRNEKYLNIRAFTQSQKLAAYERQKGMCPICGEHFEVEQMEADHITPWSQGGATSKENCQMLCRECNRRKSDK